MTSNDPYGTNFPTTANPTAQGYPAGGYVPPLPGDPGYVPVIPPTPPAEIYHAPTQEEQPSTADVAKGQAGAVAGGAADAAQHVAGVAKEQVGQVTAEASRQVKHLFGQAQSELSGQAQTQQERAASGLHSIGDQLGSMAQKSEQPGAATDLARQASDKAHQVAQWLENRDPAAVLDEVRSFARGRPGAFLGIALGLGVVAGRLARGMTADPDETAAGGKSSTPRPSGQANQLSRAGQRAALPAADVPAGELYGTGLVPDWTSKPAAELGEVR